MIATLSGENRGEIGHAQHLAPLAERSEGVLARFRVRGDRHRLGAGDCPHPDPLPADGGRGRGRSALIMPISATRGRGR